MRGFPYEEILDTYSVGALREMARGRGIHSPGVPKPDLIRALGRLVDDSASVHAALGGLDDRARVLLAAFHGLEGMGSIQSLEIVHARSGLGGFDTALRALMQRALVLYSARSYYGMSELWPSPEAAQGFRERDPTQGVLAVPLALELVSSGTVLPPLRLDGAEPEVARSQEQSPSNLLQGLFSLVRWSEERRIKITKTTGALAKPDLRGLAKRLNCEEDFARWIGALARASGLLQEKYYVAEPHPHALEFFRKSPRDQVAGLLGAWIAIRTWSEFFRIPGIASHNAEIPRQDQAFSDVPTAFDLVRARAFHSGLIARAASKQWIPLGAFLVAAREEKPDFLIPAQPRSRWVFTSSNSATYRGFWKAGGTYYASGSELRRDRDWDLVQGGFVSQVLEGPLRWLGLVALGYDEGDELVAFRLTPLGESVFGLAEALQPEEASGPPPKTFTLQPNFEIVAYTEPEHLPALFELERFAERVSAERVAQYRLTRESVYRGLQDGLTAEAITRFLGERSTADVPQNVAYTLNDWQQLFDTIHLRRSALLVQTEDDAELESLIGQLPEGALTRVGPGWGVLEPPLTDAVRHRLAELPDAGAFDYGRDIARALSVTEQLEIHAPVRDLDLRLRGRLEQFAEPDLLSGPVASFRITRDSLGRAQELGMGPGEVLRFLEAYGQPPLPADVGLTLRGWAGEVALVSLAPAVVLATDEATFGDFTAVDELRALLWLKLSDRAALVREEHVPALEAALARRGIRTVDRLALRLSAPGARASKPVAATHLSPSRRVSPAEVLRIEPSPSAAASRPRPAHPLPSPVRLDYERDETGTAELLDQAAAKGRRVLMDYTTSAGHRDLHKVDPIEVEHGDHARLWAYCQQSGSLREYRIARIAGIALLEERFSPARYTDYRNHFDFDP